MNTSKELRDNVNHIIKTLEHPGMYCQECSDALEDNSTDTVCHCGTEFSPMSGYDYINDVLDIEYVVSSSKEYLGARILVTFGGPNIWINTRNNSVEGYWGSESFTTHYKDALNLDDTMQEMYCSV